MWVQWAKFPMHAVHEQLDFVLTHGLFRSATAHQVFATLLALRSTPHRELKKVSRVDVFISHSWSCAWWKKALAICHHLNFHFAFACCGMAALSAVILLVLRAGGFSGLAELPGRLLYMSCVSGLHLSKSAIRFFFTTF